MISWNYNANLLPTQHYNQSEVTYLDLFYRDCIRDLKEKQTKPAIDL